MSRRHPRATNASGRDGSPPQEPDGTRRDALLATEGGAGAELRGHVPQHPDGVVLVLHGGAQASRMPVAWWRLAVLRMAPFALTIVAASRRRPRRLRLKNRVRGWNGSRQDPVHDARWALDRIRRTLPGLPVVVVGHSMGGRVALQLERRARRRGSRGPRAVGRERRASAPPGCLPAARARLP